MKYDFTTVLDRHGNDALAVDCFGTPNGFVPSKPMDGYSVIPMWVADMNFLTAPSIVAAVQKRAAHASFGYYIPRDKYFDSITSWHAKRFGVDVPRETIGYENGVLGALSSALGAFTVQGEKILVNGPTYIGFLHTFEDLKRETSVSQMYRDNNGIWRMDFEDMERRIIEDNIKFAVFCSPHNPTGRVWERWEIEKFADLCAKHDVLIFSDEIWSDLVLLESFDSSILKEYIEYNNASNSNISSQQIIDNSRCVASEECKGIKEGRKHIPTYSVNDDAKQRTITAYAPSKTFSLAGLIGSYHVIFNEELRKKVVEEGNKTHYNSMNVLSEHALIGAYSDEGEEWLEELLQVLTENVNYVSDYVEENYKAIKFARPQGTYMVYLDLTDFLKENNLEMDAVLKYGWDRGVVWQDGRPFGHDNTIRLNLALPLWQIKEAISRLQIKSL